MIIAVDGPLASGKGTIARALAEHYRLPYLDTGKLYRATALAVIDAGIDPADEPAASAAARSLKLASVDETRIRSAEAGAMASRIAALPGVRAALYDLQRAFAQQPGGAILDGRDIGTVICPEAEVKLYVVANAEIRAGRRWRELAAAGDPISFEAVLAQTHERDARDTGRADAPMRAADDATLLETSSLSIDAAIAAAIRIVDNAKKV